MPRQLTDLALKKLADQAADSNPSASRPWGVCAMTSGATLRVYGWCKYEWQAKQLAVYHGIRCPFIARFYIAKE